MAEETKVEETKPEEPEVEDEESEPEAEVAAEPVEGEGAFEVGVSQPPAVSDTLFVPAAHAKDGVTNLNPGTQYLRADQFGRAPILHSDRVSAGSLPARPTFTDRVEGDSDVAFVAVVGSGANNPAR